MVSNFQATPENKIEIFGNCGFTSYLVSGVDFARNYITPVREKKDDDFYDNLIFFGDFSAGEYLDKEVLYQLDNDGRVIAFVEFRIRETGGEIGYAKLGIVSTHTLYRDQGRSKVLLNLVGVRLRKLGITSIKLGGLCKQDWDSIGNKWANTIIRCLQGSGLDTIQ